MAIYDGVVTLDQTDVPVIVELDDSYVRLSAGGAEIGHWSTDECEINHVSDSTYSITAEDETLRFVPNQPGLFDAAVNGGTPSPLRSVPLPPEPAPEPPADGVREAPPPRPLTMGLFYALCTLTLGLALWSLARIFFL